MVHRIHSRKEAARFMPSSLRRVLWAAAVLPPVLLLLYIYRKDRVEKEPPRLLLRLFLGGCLAVLPAMALELAGLRVSLRPVSYTPLDVYKRQGRSLASRRTAPSSFPPPPIPSP